MKGFGAQGCNTLLVQPKAGQDAGSTRGNCTQPRGKMASAEPSSFCQLPFFPADFSLFLHLITAEAQ